MVNLRSKDGKIIIKNGKVGIAEECCCAEPGCCIIDGLYDPTYKTKASCEVCFITNYSCYEQLQTQCDGTCPDGTVAMSDLVSLQFLGCFGSGGTASVSIGCGSILSATITQSGGGYAIPGRVAPTLMASVNGTGDGAELFVTLAQEQDICGVDYWSVASLGVTATGSGYTEGDPVVFTLGPGDTQADQAFAYVNVNDNGEVIGAAMIINGSYYHEDISLPAYVDNVVVNVLQSWPSNGGGESIVATVDNNPSSANFGKIIGLAVMNGGGGFAKLCERTTIVESCNDCPTLSIPEYSTCINNMGGPCGTWADPCCGTISRAFEIGVQPEDSGPCGTGGSSAPTGPYLQETINVFNPCNGPVKVTISGDVDDQLVVDGELIGEECQQASSVFHTFTTTAESFTVAAKDNYWINVGYNLNICFECIT